MSEENASEDEAPDEYYSWEDALERMDQMLQHGISSGLSAQAVRRCMLESMGNEKRFDVMTSKSKIGTMHCRSTNTLPCSCHCKAVCLIVCVCVLCAYQFKHSHVFIRSISCSYVSFAGSSEEYKNGDNANCFRICATMISILSARSAWSRSMAMLVHSPIAKQCILIVVIAHASRA